MNAFVSGLFGIAVYLGLGGLTAYLLLGRLAWDDPLAWCIALTWPVIGIVALMALVLVGFVVAAAAILLFEFGTELASKQRKSR